MMIFTAKIFTLQGAATIFCGGACEAPGHFDIPSNYTTNIADAR
jgi:hypothetical protein